MREKRYQFCNGEGKPSSTVYTVQMANFLRLSDTMGRRLVLLICSLGLVCTSTSLGLATRYIGLVITRSAEGLLNGNYAIIKAILAELADGDEAHLAKVFSLLPLMWAVGATIG